MRCFVGSAAVATCKLDWRHNWDAWGDAPATIGRSQKDSKTEGGPRDPLRSNAVAIDLPEFDFNWAQSRMRKPNSIARGLFARAEGR